MAENRKISSIEKIEYLGKSYLIDMNLVATAFLEPPLMTIILLNNNATSITITKSVDDSGGQVLEKIYLNFYTKWRNFRIERDTEGYSSPWI